MSEKNPNAHPLSFENHVSEGIIATKETGNIDLSSAKITVKT